MGGIIQNLQSCRNSTHSNQISPFICQTPIIVICFKRIFKSLSFYRLAVHNCVERWYHSVPCIEGKWQPSCSGENIWRLGKLAMLVEHTYYLKDQHVQVSNQRNRPTANSVRKIWWFLCPWGCSSQFDSLKDRLQRFQRTWPRMALVHHPIIIS